jgi:hypothetical protein
MLFDDEPSRVRSGGHATISFSFLFLSFLRRRTLQKTTFAQDERFRRFLDQEQDVFQDLLGEVTKPYSIAFLFS